MVYIILYHFFCLAMLIFLYLGQREKKLIFSGSLGLTYVMTGLVIGSDCLWEILSHQGCTNTPLLYIININYYLGSVTGVYFWLRYTLKKLHSILYKEKSYLWLLSLPAGISVLLTVTDPWTGYLFTLRDGQYFRGPLFIVSACVSFFYLIFTVVYAFVRSVQESRPYLKKQYRLFAVYAVPVILCGLIQALFSIDTNCLSPVFGFALVYQCGLDNETKDNGDRLRAIAQSYSAAFIINADDRRIRVLAADEEYTPLRSIIRSQTYDRCVEETSGRHVVPEDLMAVRKGFALKNVLHQLEAKKTYSMIYRIRTSSGERYNKATFMKAFGQDGRNEVFLGIDMLDLQQTLLQQKDDSDAEREMLEKVREHFTGIMANVIEARDVDSGEHVMRVKSITQQLCDRIMTDYPEYGLTPQKVRYITTGSALHDIGKIMIPDAILLKPGKLTAEEFTIMKTHSEKGCIILDRLPADLDEDYIRYAKEICRWHHEKYDGSGYPDGLKGEEIPLSAQIVSLADCFDALTTARPYKEAYSEEKAYRMIMNGECGAFSEKLLNCFREVVRG